MGKPVKFESGDASIEIGSHGAFGIGVQVKTKNPDGEEIGVAMVFTHDEAWKVVKAFRDAARSNLWEFPYFKKAVR